MKPQVAVVLVNWNGWRQTLECLQSLLGDLKTGRAVAVVVDNNSTDDSTSRILNWLEEVLSLNGLEYLDAYAGGGGSNRQASVTLLKSKYNAGFSGGNNIGIRYALDSYSPDFLWLLNNDAVVTSGSLPELIRCARANPRLGVLGSTLVEYHEPNRVQSAGGGTFNWLLAKSKPAHYGAPISVALRNPGNIWLDYASGASMFLPTDVIRKVGLLNEDYFLYFEELDYAIRARKAGYQVGWCSRSIVRHRGGSSAGSRSADNPQKSRLAEYHSNLSALRFVRRFSPLMFPLTFVFRFGAKCIFFAATRRFDLFRPLVHAYAEYLTPTSRTS
jgi:GT2 family glycosyltransferase